MASIKFFEGLENILVVGGTDVYNMSRKELTTFLDGTGTSPRVYRHGLYDFTLCWWNGRTGNASHNSWDPGATPRPIRGRVYIPGVPTSTTPDRIAKATYTLLHEVLHHWMVYGDIALRGQVLPPQQDFLRQLRRGDVRFTLPPMLGRQNSHWSPYWQSDDSVMDGTRYAVNARLGVHARWDSVQQTALSFAVDNVPVTMTTTYSDLDLYGMGVLDAAECYPGDQGRLRWMEPRFVGPLGFLMGTMAAIRDGSVTTVYEFGYVRDYDGIEVRRNGQRVAGARIPGLNPFSLPGSGVVFRLVLSGGRLHFDARIDPRVRLGCLALTAAMLNTQSREPPFDFFDPLLNLPVNTDFQVWTRVHTEIPSAIDDVVVGTHSQRWEKCWTDLTFEQPQLRTRSPSGADRTTELDIAFGWPDTTPGAWQQDWASWPEREPRNFLPTPGADLWRDGAKRLHLALPHMMWDGSDFQAVDPAEASFDPAGQDGGARVLWKMPADFFAFAVSAAPGFVLVSPWTGGSMNGKYLIGLEHRDPVSEVTFPGMPALKRTPPPDDTYRAAHVIVAEDVADITRAQVEAVDLRRRALDEAFGLATRGRRHMRSDLEPS